MASVSDINAQLATLQQTATDVLAIVTALKSGGGTGTPVATQADLDAISAGLTAAQTALSQITL